MSIEKVPTIQQSDLLSAIITPPNEEVEEIVDNINSALNIGIALNIRSVRKELLLHNCGLL